MSQYPMQQNQYMNDKQPMQMQQPPMHMQQPMNVQPQGMPPMAPMMGGNRNVKNIPMEADGREWSNGLCACADCGSCFLAWCCPCIVYGYVKRRVEWLNTKGVPDPEHGGSCCSGDCMLHGVLNACLGAGCVLQMSNRGIIRQRYQIKGSGCGDCMTAWCCSPCELSQESAELELEERSLLGAHHHA